MIISGDASFEVEDVIRKTEKYYPVVKFGSPDVGRWMESNSKPGRRKKPFKQCKNKGESQKDKNLKVFNLVNEKYKTGGGQK